MVDGGGEITTGIQESNLRYVNPEHPYVSELGKKGIGLSEVSLEGNPMQALVCRFENKPVDESKSDLIISPGFLGTTGGIAYIDATFLETLQDQVDTVVGFNANFSGQSIENSAYNDDVLKQVQAIADVYEQSAKEQNPQKLKSVKLLGHSMGGNVTPLLARELLARGYKVDGILMVAPPGMEAIGGKQMFQDILHETTQNEHYDIDAKNLFPNPIQVTEMRDQLKGLYAAKTRGEYLSPQKQEWMLSLERSIERGSRPDPVLAQTAGDEIMGTVNIIDKQIESGIYLVGEIEGNVELGEEEKKKKIASLKKEFNLNKLQEQRNKLLRPAIKAVISGKLSNVSLDPDVSPSLIGGIGKHPMENIKQLLKLNQRYGTDEVVFAMQDLVNYVEQHAQEDNLPNLHIAVIGGNADHVARSINLGSNVPYVRNEKNEMVPDPYVNATQIPSEKLVGINRWNTGKHTTYTETLLPIDHYTIASDPLSVAEYAQRFFSHEANTQAKGVNI